MMMRRAVFKAGEAVLIYVKRQRISYTHIIMPDLLFKLQISVYGFHLSTRCFMLSEERASLNTVHQHTKVLNLVMTFTRVLFRLSTHECSNIRKGPNRGWLHLRYFPISCSCCPSREILGRWCSQDHPIRTQELQGSPYILRNIS